MERFDLKFPPEMLAAIDAAKGPDVSRAAWIRRAVAERLERNGREVPAPGIAEGSNSNRTQ